MKQVITANVPCQGCTACCHGDLVFIHPECGDIASEYETWPQVHPITRQPGLALKHKNGSCIYLGETGCTIHPRRPAMCREFDCRRFYLGFKDRAERRRMVKAGAVSKEVIQAGLARLHTLEEPT
jgi:Fe-S-cluster containining protein